MEVVVEIVGLVVVGTEGWVVETVDLAVEIVGWVVGTADSVAEIVDLVAVETEDFLLVALDCTAGLVAAEAVVAQVASAWREVGAFVAAAFSCLFAVLFLHPAAF